MSSFAINSTVSKAAAIIIVAQLLSVGPVTITCQVINLLFSRLYNCKTKTRKIKVSMKSPITHGKKTTPIEPICKLPSAE
jgi:Leu/Phe-tRNA-protein transferase